MTTFVEKKCVACGNVKDIAVGHARCIRCRLAPPPRPASEERFTDHAGHPIFVGDRVRAWGVNAGLEGVVVRLVKDPSKKPFKVMSLNGRNTFFMNPDWTEVVL